MKELTLTYEDTEQLKSVIDNNYFINGDMGKKGNEFDFLTVDKDGVIHKALEGMNYSKVRIKSSKILGTLLCDVDTRGDNFVLIPNNTLCVKENKRYNFY